MPPIAAICLAAASPASDADGPALPRIVWPQLPHVVAKVAQLAPPGWRVEQSVVADLDGKGAPDLVAILKADDRHCVIEGSNGQPLDTSPRVVVATLAGPGGYVVTSVARDLIPRVDDPYMDDPLGEGGLTVRGRVIRVALSYFRSAGGWTTFTNTLSFRFDGKGFPLIGFDRETTQRNSGETESVSANLVTRRASIAKGSIEDERPRGPVRWKTLPARPVPTLATIGSGLDYDPLD